MPGDILADDELISDIKNSFDNEQGFSYTQIVDLPNEKFAHILIKEDNNLYALISQNGQIISGEIGPINDITNKDVQTTNACRFGDDKLIVTFTQTQGIYKQQFLQVIDINTELKISTNVEFSDSSPLNDQIMGNCQQIDDTYIGLGYIVDSIGYKYRNYNVGTNTLSTSTIMNDNASSSFMGSLTSLRDTTNLVTVWCQFVENNQQKCYFQKIQQDGTKIGSNTLVENSIFDQGYFNKPQITQSENGGFAIVFYNSQNGDIFMNNYDTNGIIICTNKIATQKRFPKIVTYLSQAFITYSNWDSDNDNYQTGQQAYITSVDLNQCSQEEEYQISNNIIFYHVNLSISSDQQATILGLQYTIQNNSQNKLQYTEYYINTRDQCIVNNNDGGGVDDGGGNVGGGDLGFGRRRILNSLDGGGLDSGDQSNCGDGNTQLQTLCTDEKFLGCYGLNMDSSSVCNGSTPENRNQRKLISEGTCICPASYFENSDKDCEMCLQINLQCTQCPEFYYEDDYQNCQQCLPGCATCSNSDSCDTCKDSQNQIEQNCQDCPQIYYTDNNGICQQCLDNCQSCSNGNSCDSCQESHQNINLNCTCPEVYYLDDNGVCQECNSLCYTCSNSNTCDLCKDELMFGESLCTVSIIGNFIQIQNDELIVNQCQSQCQTCKNATQCLTCKDSTKNVNFNCECPEIHFIDINGVCQQCSLQCQSCDNLDTCIECKENYIKQNEKCICPENFIQVDGNCLKNCQDNYYMNYNSQKCEKCAIYEDICMQECPENTTLNTSNQICEQKSNLNIIKILVVLAIALLLIIPIILYTYKKAQKNQSNKVDNLQNSNNITSNNNINNNNNKDIEQNKQQQQQSDNKQELIKDNQAINEKTNADISTSQTSKFNIESSTKMLTQNLQELEQEQENEIPASSTRNIIQNDSPLKLNNIRSSVRRKTRKKQSLNIQIN